MNAWFLRSIMAGLILSLGVIGPSESEAARLKLVVGGPEFRPFPIAVPKVEVSGGVAKEGENLAPVLTKTLREAAMLARSLDCFHPVLTSGPPMISRRHLSIETGLISVPPVFCAPRLRYAALKSV